MTKYLFDLTAYRYFDGRKIQTKRDTLQIDTDEGKDLAMSSAIFQFVDPNSPQDFASVEITTARVGDATR